MLKLLFVALLLVVIWVASLFLEIPIVVPIVLTSIILTVVITVIVVRRLLATKASRELEKAISAQAEAHARDARPDRKAELEQIAKDFGNAVGSLKRSKLGGGGNAALYQLPWYVIIGPPGSGKSTAIRASGLPFPYVSQGGAAAVRGVGGTRNCDWWLTNEAVLLDTAGRWSTEDEDRDQWLQFLTLLRKHRPDNPLNGIMLAVSIADVGGANESELESLARRMRERVDEVMGHLGVQMPIYLLFTKCDLVPGFVEMFSDLTREQRSQVFGFTLRTDQPQKDVGEAFGEKLKELSESIERRAVYRLRGERDLNVREQIFGFPQQLEVLEPQLRDLVTKIFQHNVYAENPTFRGAYFTSGTQEGRPVDRVMSRLAEAFGLARRLPESAAAEPKSYFLGDVFRTVVFPDRDVAAHSGKEIARRRRTQLGALAAIATVALLFVSLPAYAFLRNRSYLNETQTIVQTYRRTPANGMVATVAQLELLRERADELDRFVREGPPVSMRLGMFKGDVLYAPIRQLWVQEIKRTIVEPLAHEDRRRLSAFADSRSAADALSAREMLKAHLLLTQPKTHDEPSPLQPQHLDFIVQHLTERFAEEPGVDVGARARLQSHLALYARFLRDDTRIALPRDADLVARARTALTETGTANTELENIIRTAERQGLGLRLNQVQPRLRPLELEPDFLSTRLCEEGRRCPAEQYLPTNSVIRGAFTKRGYETLVRPHFETRGPQEDDEAWVLGAARTEDANTAEAIAELQCQYFRAYQAEWDGFIHALRLPETTRPPLDRIRELTSNPTPYERMFRLIEENLPPLPPREETEESGVGDALGERALQNAERRLSKVIGGSAASALAEQARNAREGDGPSRPVCDTSVQTVRDYLRAFTAFGVPERNEGDTMPPLPTSLDGYLEQLRLVANAMETARETDDQAAQAEVISRLEAARSRTSELIASQSGWSDTFENILNPPIQAATESSVLAEAAGAASGWCTEVVTQHDSTLAGRYPFNPRGQDASLADFAAFYVRGGGILWNYYDAHLSRHVPQNGAEFSFEQRLGQSGSGVFRGGLLSFLSRSYEVTQVFFPRDATEPRVDFEVQIQAEPRVATIELEVGGTRTEYHNGPEQWIRMSWPGTEPLRGATIQVRGAGMQEQVREEGEWGLFRLLERGTVTAGGAGARTFSMAWRLASHDVEIRMQFRPTRAEAPFFGLARREGAGLMRPMRGDNLAPPRQIVARSDSCPRASR